LLIILFYACCGEVKEHPIRFYGGERMRQKERPFASRGGWRILNILLIDDDNDCLRSMASVLNLARHACDMFGSPEQALKAYRRKTYDVVITDMIMPGMNGLQVLRQIRSINPDARVIIVTGHVEAEIIVAALNSRAYAFLGKPLKIDDLMEILEQIEQENRDFEKARKEHARLAMEYARLKRAFEDLQALLKDTKDCDKRGEA